MRACKLFPLCYFKPGALIFCHLGRSRETKRSVLLPNSEAVSRSGPASTDPLPGAHHPSDGLRRGLELPLLSPAGLWRTEGAGQPPAVSLLAVAARKQEASNHELPGDSNRSEQGGCLQQRGLPGLRPTSLPGAEGADCPQGRGAALLQRLGKSTEPESTGLCSSHSGAGPVPAL